MAATDLNLAEPIRSALIGSADISAALAVYLGEPAVFTKRPAPGDAGYPLAMVSPDITLGNEDAVNRLRPIVTRDVSIFGQNPSDYRTVESLGYLVRALFHRKRFAIVVPNFQVVEIVAAGPRIAPADDDDHLCRLVSLRIRLRDLAS